MIIRQLTCSSCGANHLRATSPRHYSCEYCDATYVIDYDEATGELQDARVSGNMQELPTFAVHGMLYVSGNMNEIKLVSRHKRARHVGDLHVSGNMNEGKVVLLDGADFCVSGNMNAIKDKR